MSDPFATDPFSNAPENTVPETTMPVEPEMEANPVPDGRISVTLKRGPGYGDPWIVVEGSSVPTVRDLVTDVVRQGLPKVVSIAAEEFAKTAPAQPSKQPQQTYQQSQQPQLYQQNSNQTPPGMTAPHCQHGEKRYIVGKYGPFWGCPADRNDPSRCKPQKIQ